MHVEIRPLEKEDAKISYMWRNNSIIWKYTGSRPNVFVTEEIEKTWIKEVLQRTNEKRFAILVDGMYVGNTYLTDIGSDKALFHIFIGEISYWGKGVATQVLNKVMDYAECELRIKKIQLSVSYDNVSAVRLYRHAGFVECGKMKNKILMEKVL